MPATHIDPVLLAITAAGTVAVVFFWYGFGELRTANRILRSGPAATLEAPTDGRVELRGRARPIDDDRTLRSPFTDTPCLVCEYCVEEARTVRNERHWVTIASGVQSVPFRLEDDAGTALVTTLDADFRLEADTRIDVPGGTEPSAEIARALEQNAIERRYESAATASVGRVSANDRRVRERLLVPGDDVSVLGTVRTDSAALWETRPVDVVVGAPDAAPSPRLSDRLRDLLFDDPVVISDDVDRQLGVRAGAYGVSAITIALVAITVTVASFV
ncbi:GIDE domain-containing protein [Natronolimnohabitans sp. A-GB9]|uniref:GIDE domain-containing protein n=1 Tax=Natronolimnohabitans sp. A-GB9 TaxID=3069757 RepID=UPI0027B6C2F4|nr:GIDE domain-containing protein [Natronolimnohabitans sp. A-GB9]MDQ2050555.1 GIDE domain-containing protein [Natronolimnohabitans sp. A-GB9]